MKVVTPTRAMARREKPRPSLPLPAPAPALARLLSRARVGSVTSCCVPLGPTPGIAVEPKGEERELTDTRGQAEGHKGVGLLEWLCSWLWAEA
jgi:hypothetical protein